MPFTGPPDFGRRTDLPEPLDSEAAIKAGTTGKLHALDAKLHAEMGGKQMKFFQETTQDWMKRVSANPAFRQSVQSTDIALTTTVPKLPASIQGRWQRHLNALKNFGTRGDPLQILRYISNIQDDLENLHTVHAVGSPLAQQGAAEISQLLAGYQFAIGPAHPGHTIEDQYRSRNPRIAAQGKNILATGVFLIAASAAIFSGLLAFFSKPDERQWKVFGIWATVALLAAGFGDITKTGPERLQGQVDFLVRPRGEWERLQMGGPGNPAYRLGGPDMGTFVRRVYDQRNQNAALNAALRNTGPLTDGQRKAVLAIAPPSIHPQLLAMMNSGSGTTQGIDFRRMIGQLNQARTEEAQTIVVGYVQAGASRDNLAMFAKARGGPALPPTPSVPPPPPSGGFGGAPVT